MAIDEMGKVEPLLLAVLLLDDDGGALGIDRATVAVAPLSPPRDSGCG